MLARAGEVITAETRPPLIIAIHLFSYSLLRTCTPDLPIELFRLGPSFHAVCTAPQSCRQLHIKIARRAQEYHLTASSTTTFLIVTGVMSGLLPIPPAYLYNYTAVCQASGFTKLIPQFTNKNKSAASCSLPEFNYLSSSL
jgi:hypothetical protein